MPFGTGGEFTGGGSGGGGGGAGTINDITSTGNTLAVTNPTGPITNLEIHNSVALPGAPTTTTASPLDNSTKVATTAYVDSAVSAATNPSLYLSATYR